MVEIGNPHPHLGLWLHRLRRLGLRFGLRFGLGLGLGLWLGYLETLGWLPGEKNKEPTMPTTV